MFGFVRNFLKTPTEESKIDKAVLNDVALTVAGGVLDQLQPQGLVLSSGHSISNVTTNYELTGNAASDEFLLGYIYGCHKQLLESVTPLATAQDHAAVHSLALAFLFDQESCAGVNERSNALISKSRYRFQAGEPVLKGTGTPMYIHGMNDGYQYFSALARRRSFKANTRTAQHEKSFTSVFLHGSAERDVNDDVEKFRLKTRHAIQRREQQFRWPS